MVPNFEGHKNQNKMSISPAPNHTATLFDCKLSQNIYKNTKTADIPPSFANPHTNNRHALVFRGPHTHSPPKNATFSHSLSFCSCTAASPPRRLVPCHHHLHPRDDPPIHAHTHIHVHEGTIDTDGDRTDAARGCAVPDTLRHRVNVYVYVYSTFVYLYACIRVCIVLFECTCIFSTVGSIRVYQAKSQHTCILTRKRLLGDRYPTDDSQKRV
jgi:hypothetical protein